MNISAVAANFDRGSLCYDDCATVQQSVVSDLANLMKKEITLSRSLVDLGCGTGALLERCHQLNSSANLTGVDISHNMLSKAAQRVPKLSPVLVPMESTGLAGGLFDLVLSSSALQWCDVGLAAEEMARLCSHNGVIGLAWFSPGTLNSWRSLWGGKYRKLPHRQQVEGE